MKYIQILALTLLLGYSQIAQAQETLYGTVRYDGFQHVIKGAFWATRPEAKMVYNGGNPPGVEVITLEDDYYVRFIDSEHNENDKNYIIIPKGEKIYTKGSSYYLAICGNEIEYLRPVNRVKIIEVPAPAPVVDTTMFKLAGYSSGGQPIYINVQNTNTNKIDVPQQGGPIAPVQYYAGSNEPVGVSVNVQLDFNFLRRQGFQGDYRQCLIQYNDRCERDPRYRQQCEPIRQQWCHPRENPPVVTDNHAFMGGPRGDVSSNPHGSMGGVVTDPSNNGNGGGGRADRVLQNQQQVTNERNPFNQQYVDRRNLHRQQVTDQRNTTRNPAVQRVPKQNNLVYTQGKKPGYAN